MVNKETNITEDEFILWRNLHRIGDEITKYEDNVFSEGHLTNAQYRMLIVIGFLTKYNTDPVKMTDLLSIHNRSLVSISLIISRMEIKGLVKKVRGIQDQRSVCVTLTPKGEKLLTDATKPTTELVKKLFSVYSNAELKNAVFLINKLMDTPELSSAQANEDMKKPKIQRLVEYFNGLSNSSP